MTRLTIEAIHSQLPRACLIGILKGSDVTDPALLAAALNQWILIHVDLLDEFEELLIGPEQMIREISLHGRTYGDCDDIAMLAASILASAGAAVQFVAAFPQPDGSYGHVFVRYRFPKEDFFRDFDPTIANLQGTYPVDVLIQEVIS